MSPTITRDAVQERAQITREQLLAAAINCFARLGYDASSTRKIEAAAGVKRGLIGYHFGTKEMLWKAALTWLIARAAGELSATESAADNVPPAERLRYFVRAYVRFCARYPEFNRLMIREGMDNDWRLDWLVENAARPWYERLHAVFDQAVTLNAAPAMAFHHFYYILTGAATLFFSMAPEAERLAGINPYDESTVSAHADALATLLFPGDHS